MLKDLHNLWYFLEETGVSRLNMNRDLWFQVYVIELSLWAPGMGWGWGLWSIQVELPGPAMQGCWGWIQSCHFSAQLLTALPHLQTSAGSVNISTYVLAVNRFCKSCQYSLVLVLLSGSESPLCLLVPKALGVDVGRASNRRRTRKLRKTAAGNLQGDSLWGGSWFFSA